MIEEIKIKNFKSLKDITVNVKNLNLLVGLNGMGKSSFIQSLLLLKQSPNLFYPGELSLNGDLVQIGKGKDALYQFAIEESIGIALKVSNHEEVSWNFIYKPGDDDLYSKQVDPSDKVFDSRIYIEPVFENFQYIGADRLGPQSIYDTSSSAMSDNNLGVRGEYTAHYLHLFGNKYKVDEKMKHEKTIDMTLINQVNGWLSEISPGVKLNVIEVPHIDKLLLSYQFELANGRTEAFKPLNVGFGLSYVLPIIVSLLIAIKDKIIIIENPESHIHPRGQAELGKLMALAAANGAQLFIETHSDHIINGIRVAVKDQFIDKDLVSISYFDKVTTKDEQYTRITNLKVDKQGELSEYPENFLDEWNNQLIRLM